MCATAVLLTASSILATGVGGEGAGQPTAQAPPPGEAPSVAGTRFETAGEPVRVPVSNAERIKITAGPANGSVDVERDAVRYTPAAGYIGPDRLTLSLCGARRCVTPTISVRTTPTGLSALSRAPARMLVDSADRARRPGARVKVRLPRGLAAAAVSVAVRDAVRDGAVTVAAGGKPIHALRVPAAGATVSNTVLVPVRDRSLIVDVGSGGRLVVNLVGSFKSAASARAGRFIGVDPVRVAHLVTIRDGREATVDAAAYGARPGIRAALVLVTAQTGPNPSWVTFRSRANRVDQTMPWAPDAKRSIERRGLALVRVNADGKFSFRYDHGSVIDLDVLGYFTGPRAKPAVRGLLVPRDPDTVFKGVVGRHRVPVRARQARRRYS